MLTNQSAFDTVVRHLKSQGCASTLDDGSCAYAGTDGRACAVGALLPHDLCEDLDRLDFSGWLDVKRSHTQSALDACDLLAGVSDDLLVAMQSAHDLGDCAEDFWDAVSRRLFDVAAEFNLAIPPELQ